MSSLAPQMPTPPRDVSPRDAPGHAPAHPPGEAPYEAAWLRLTSLLLGLGALGVLATSACYALAGPLAALPGGATSVEAARAATAAAAGWMRAASLLGMPGDLLLAVAALMMAARQMSAGRGNGALAVAGWLMLAITSALFVVVDAMVGFVLPPLALWPGPGEGVAAYAAMRALFDTLFLIGSWALGAGALAVAWRAGLSPRWALWALRLAGALALAGGTGGLLGGAAAALAGPAIALSVLALIGVAVSLWPRAALAAPAAGQSPP